MATYSILTELAQDMDLQNALADLNATEQAGGLSLTTLQQFIQNCFDAGLRPYQEQRLFKNKKRLDDALKDADQATIDQVIADLKNKP